MAIWLTGLVDALRRGGCTVFEVAGWRTRSYAGWPAGYVVNPTHVMVHHTASKASIQSDLAYILQGAPNPTGGPRLAPIGNIYLDRNGGFHVVAAGRAITNGKGSSRPWNGGVPDDQMNSYSISIEAANNGIGEVWPQAQCDAYAKGVAALCREYNIPVAHVRAHHEWSPGRKIDPAGPTPSHQAWGGLSGAAEWHMDAFRTDVARILAPPTPNFITVEDAMQILNPPIRAYDSRKTTRHAASETRSIKLGVTGKVAMVNIAVVDPSAGGFATAWGSGSRPNTSSINYTKGVTLANCVPVPMVNGAIQIYTSAGTDIVVDVLGVWP